MTSEQDSGLDGRRRPGRKPFPVLSFEQALELAKGINEHGVDGRIRRMTLFQQFGLSPGSGPSRQLVSTSRRYGLTSGNYSSEYLELTNEGKVACGGASGLDDRSLKAVFDLAITRNPIFFSIYEQLKNQRLPNDPVLADLLFQRDIDEGDCELAAKVFTDNLRYLGLLQDHQGSEYVIPLEQLLEELPETGDGVIEEEVMDSEEESTEEQSATIPATTPSAINRPSLHINIQIHIDSSATSDQIDQIFSSMARHLYMREV